MPIKKDLTIYYMLKITIKCLKTQFKIRTADPKINIFVFNFKNLFAILNTLKYFKNSFLSTTNLEKILNTIFLFVTFWFLVIIK